MSFVKDRNLGGTICRLFELRWYLGLGLFALLVIFKVHGVSLASWNGIVQNTTESYSYPTVGINRTIRSDEYAVSVPLVMAQCEHPDFFPRINERCTGTGMDMFVTTPPNPVWDWTVIGQAPNWGYFIFGFERGLSWNWFLRYLCGFLFAFEFFLIWLHRDRPLAFTAALAVTLGSPTQWWTTTVPYLQLFFFASLVFMHKLFEWRKTRLQVFAGVGLLVSLCSFAFSFYPPFQYLYSVILVLLSAEMIWMAFGQTGERRCRTAWLVLIFVMLAFALEWGYFFSLHKETLLRISGSAYPGSRIYTGGSLRQFLEIQTWEMLCLFTPIRDVAFSNVCRIAVFFVPMVAFFFAAAKSWRKLIQASLAFPFLLMWGIVMLTWMVFRWPATLARITLFSQLNISRVAVVSSFLFLLLVFKLVSCWQERERVAGKGVIFLCLSLSLSALVASFVFSPELLDYFTGTNITRGLLMLVLGVVLLSAISIGLLRHNRKLFIGAYVLVSLLTGAFVNPLSIGASPLRDKQLADAVQEVIRKHGDGQWLCNRSEIAQFLIAHGNHCVTGVQQVANPELWRKVDPNEIYKTAWSRYAHISVEVCPLGPVRAEASRADHLTWFLDQDAIRALDVKYLVWTNEKVREPWVEYLGRVRHHFIYKVVED